MKIKTIAPEDITGNKLAYKAYRKSVKPSLKKMLAEHNSPETPTQFFIKTNYEFADMKGKKMSFIIPGDQPSAWLNLVKSEIKDDKKNTCIGQCYTKKNPDGGFVLVLLPEKGAAKKNLMKKQLEKFALKGTPFTIEIAAGGELEEDNADDAVVEDIDLPEDDADDDDNDDTDDQVDAAATVEEEVGKKPLSAQELLANHKSILEKFKSLKDGKHDADSLKLLFKQVSKWQKYYELLEAGQKEKLAAHAEQVKKILDATLQMIKADNVLEKDIDTVVELIDQLVENPTDELHEQILTALKKVEKIAKSLSADTILEQVEELRSLLG